MMAAWQCYLQPQSAAEALECLESAPGPAKIIAGGTDLLIDLQQGRHPPVHTLVDVTGVAEMRAVRPDGDAIFLGAAVTHFEILQHPLLKEHAPCLVEACGLIGGPQVRNVATIGGNVAHALPAGDGTIALVALAAEAQVLGAEGRRWLPVESLFLAPGHTVLDERRELLVGFRISLQGPGETSAFRRIMRPQGVAIAILNMGAWVRWTADGRIEDVRLALGPAGPVPFRSRGTEAYLRGRRIDRETLTRAARELLEEARLRPSPHRATLDYRQHLVPVLLRRVLEGAGEKS